MFELSLGSETLLPQGAASYDFVLSIFKVRYAAANFCFLYLADASLLELVLVFKIKARLFKGKARQIL